MVFSHVVFSYPFYNLISIFTSAILSVWFAIALIRFINVLVIRAAVVNGRIVNIRGIANYISAFVEISNQAHIDAIIHTRQTNPPKKLKSIYLPFVIDNIAYQRNGVMNLDIWISNNCAVYLLIDFNMTRFKEVFQSLNSSRSNSRYGFFVNNLMNASSLSHEDLNEFLNSDICHDVYFFGNLSSGNHKLDVQLLQRKWKDSNRPSSMAVLIIPNKYNMNSSTSNISSDIENPIAVKQRIQDDNIQVSSSATTGILSNLDSLALAFNILDESDIHKIKFSEARLPSTYESSQQILHISNCYIYSRSGYFYSSQEVFGWKSLLSTEQNNQSSPVTSISQNVNAEIQSFDEECVICLSDKKNVTLLPCRHLCVCNSCLVHIDKCPVCRTSFDEYVQINLEEVNTVRLPLYNK